MQTDLLPLLLMALLGYTCGALTPLARWKVAGCKRIAAERRQRISDWRSCIDSHFASDANESEFRNTAWYLSLRSQLRPQTLGRFDAFEFSSQGRLGFAAGEEATRKAVLLDEVMRIERDWKLI